jgi:hypothetical protein
MSFEPVPRVEKLSPEIFATLYAGPGRPVVITNALRWPAFERWTHEWFRDNFGATEVALSVNPTHTHRVVRMRLGAYINRILADQRMEGGLYLDQFPLSRLPELARDFTVPVYCDQRRTIWPHLWLGPGTTVLSFHKDNHDPLVQVDNIFVQIRGRKRVILASPDNDPLMYPRPPEAGAYWHSQVNPEAPDLERFPLFTRVALQDAVVGPGDIIFIPRDYWHYVRALERSISLSFWWNPCRLMEIVQLVRTKSRDEVGQLRASGKWTVMSADVHEIGGQAQLERAFAEFNDLSLVSELCARLALLADEAAHATIEAALKNVINSRRT